MTLATETDPREAVRLLLTDNNATANDYANTGSVPTIIEVVEASTLNEKLTATRAADKNALYVWRPASGEISKFGADGSTADRTQRVRVECYAPDASSAEGLKEDVISITAGYATDNKTNTQFNDIWPEEEIDTRHESMVRPGDASVEAVLVRLRRADSV